MIEAGALDFFCVALVLEDNRVLAIEVMIGDRKLLDSRLTLSASVLSSKAHTQVQIRRELIRLLGEVGSQLDFDLATALVQRRRAS